MQKEFGEAVREIDELRQQIDKERKTMDRAKESLSTLYERENCINCKHFENGCDVSWVEGCEFWEFDKEKPSIILARYRQMEDALRQIAGHEPETKQSAMWSVELAKMVLKEEVYDGSPTR